MEHDVSCVFDFVNVKIQTVCINGSEFLDLFFSNTDTIGIVCGRTKGAKSKYLVAYIVNTGRKHFSFLRI